MNSVIKIIDDQVTSQTDSTRFLELMIDEQERGQSKSRQIYQKHNNVCTPFKKCNLFAIHQH